MQRIHINIYHDTRYLKPNGTGQVKICANFKEAGRKYFNLGLWVSVADWQKMVSGKARGELKDMMARINAERVKAEEIANLNPFISPETFAMLFEGRFVSVASVKALYESKFKELAAAGKYSSLTAYKCSWASLRKVAGDGILLHNLDIEFLRAWESTMVKSGARRSTVGIYMRCLKHIFNNGIKMKLVSPDLYPFGAGRYQITRERSFKVSLDKDEQKVVFGKLDDQEEEYAVSMWMLSYYLVGMNFMDLARLRTENISADTVTYHRQKTHGRSGTGTPIVLPLHPIAKEILNRYGTHSPYLLGVLEDGISDKTAYYRVLNWRRRVRKGVNAAFGRMGLKKKVILYTARHTAANNLLLNGVDIKTISKFLGHTSILTTERYLEGLPFSKQKEAISGL